MYVPSQFSVNDPARLATFLHQHSFATVVTLDGHSPFASHIPVLFLPERGSKGVLTGHFARANPQWQHLTAAPEVLVIFQGPHAYVSPSWYKSEPAVPTWNYAAVHAYGTATLLESEAELEALLQATIDKYESGNPKPWHGELPADFKSRMTKGIVGFEIAVTRLEGKFKLSQNRPPGDVAGVIEALARSSDPTDRALAALMAG
jgi:transcriptional regulator